MRKVILSTVLLALFSLVSLVSNAQLSVTTLSADYTVDFDNTVANVNNGVYNGTGFANAPAAGQCDADAWELFGMSDGNKLFGAEATTLDFARGTSIASNTGGFYAYEVETGNFAFGMLPGGSDITPGYVAIKIQNNTGGAVDQVDFSYDVWVHNWAARSQKFNGEYSLDGSTWVPITDLLFNTPEALDAVPAWVKTSLSVSENVTLANGDYIYFRWFTDDNTGAGSRDRIAVDNFTVNMKAANYPDWCNIQMPALLEINEGTTGTVYGQVLETGITEAAGQGAGILGWLYYNDADTDPSTWTNSIAATYSADDGNNDVYSAEIGTGLNHGTYYYATAFTVDGGPVKFGGFNGGFWDGTTNVSGELRIAGIRITSPEVPGTVYHIGDVITLNWNSSHLTGNVMVAVDLNNGDGYFDISPEIDIALGTYNINIPSDAGEATGAKLKVYLVADNSVYGEFATFDIEDLTAPEIVDFDADNNAIDVPVNKTFSIEFDEKIAIGTGNIYIKLYSDNSIVQTIDVTTCSLSGNRILLIDPSTDLGYATQYYLEMENTAVEDLYGNAFAGITGNAVWSFTTEDEPCYNPTLLSALNITGTTADLSWTAGGSETTWNVEVGIPGFTPGTAAAYLTYSGSDNPFTAASLNQLTNYEFYVQAVCGSENSIWTGPHAFTTVCAVLPLTIFEGFNTSGTAVLPVCWSQQYVSGTSNITFVTSGTSPAVAAPYESTRMVYWNSYSYTAGKQTRLVSSPISTMGTTNVDVEFYWYNSNSGSLSASEGVQVQYSTDGATWFDAGAFIPRYSSTNGWTKKTVTLAGFGNQNPVFVGLLFKSNYGYNCYLDALTIKPGPTCLPPSGLTSTSVLSSSATINWTASFSNPTDGYDIYYSTTSTAPDGTTTPSATVASGVTTYNMSGLSPNTTYYVWVRSNCGSGDISGWTTNITFTTPCNPGSIPFFEGFESGFVNGSAIGGCWSQQSMVGTQVWTANSTFTDYNRTPRTGSYNAFLRYSNTDWLFYPVQLVGGTAYKFEIYARQDGTTSANASITVSYGNSNTAAAMTNPIIPLSGIVNGAYQLKSGNFTPATSGIYYIGVLGTINSSPWYISIDDISLRELSSDTDITAFSFTQQTGAATIDAGNHTVAIEVAAATDRSNLIATYTLSTGATATVATVPQVSGTTTNNFTSPLTYTITAENGTTTQDWVVTVTEATSLSNANDITAFSFPQQTGAATISTGDHTVAIEVAWTANRASLTPTISVSPLATINPPSGEVHDFTNPFTYTVTAEDGTEQIWIVTVSQQAIPAGLACSAAIDYGMINSPAINGSLTAGGNWWYMFTLDHGYGDVLVNLCGSNFDTRIAIYSDCADFAGGTGYLIGSNPSGSIGYDDDACAGGEFGVGDGNASQKVFASLDAGTYYVVIYGYSASSAGNFRLEVTGVACPDPTILTATNITQTSADLGWTAGLDETNWNIEWGLQGFTQGTGTPVNGVTNPYPLGGLTENTAYGFYVQADCGSGETSVWTGPFNFTTLAACATPTTLTATGVTATQANLGWNPVGGTSLWNVEVGATGFLPGTGAQLIAVSGTTNNPTLVTGLAATTTYQFYVQADCGSGMTSAWAGPFSFTTPCGAISSFPYTETFTGTTFAPSCWTNVKTAGTSTGTWNRATTGSTPTCSPYSAPAMARFNSFSYSSGTRGILVTPALAFPDQYYQMSFYMYRDNASTTYNDLVNVYFNTANNLTGATLLGTINREYGKTPAVATANQWYKYAYNVPTGFSGEGYFIFEGVSNYGYNIFIDEITVKALSNATDITAFSFTQQTGAATIDAGNHTVAIEVAAATDRSNLIATYTLSTGATATVATVPQVSGTTTNNFTSPLTYTITAENGITTQDWVVTVTEATSLSNENDITAFSFPQQTGAATISTGDHTVAIEVAWTANRASLTPTISVSPLATINPPSGEVHDFTNPFTYTVTAEDGTEQIWIVTVSQQAIPAGLACANPIDYGMINDPSVTGTLAANNNWWYMFTLDHGYGNVKVSLCGSDFDTRVAIYESCSDFVGGTGAAIGANPVGSIGYDDDACAGGEYGTGNTYASEKIFTSLDAGTYYLVVYGYNTSSAGNFRLEITGVACPVPTTLTATNITQTSADLGWTAGLDETNWNIEWGLQGFAQGTGTPVNGVSNPYTLGGLTANTTYSFYVQADCGSGQTSVWTGPFNFTTLASCATPTTLTATGVTATQANLGWNPVGGTSLWNVEVGATGFLPGTGAQLIAVPGTTTNPTLVTGLTAQTTYQFYVQADCGSGITSTWAGPFSFTTPCEIVSTFPITENFESTTFAPNCWTSIAGSGSWARSAAAGGYGTSTASAYVNFYGISGTTPMHLITYEFDASSLVNPQLVFDYAYATFSGEVDRLDVYYSTDGGTNYTLLLAMPGGSSGILNTGGTTTSLFVPNSAQWATQTLILPAGTNKIRFTATSAYGNNLYLDNVKIEQGPLCLTPSSLTSSAITTDAATISWTASTSNPADGYDVYYSTSSTAPDGTTTPSGSVLAGITSYDLSGLTESTMYYVWVRSNCGSSQYSEWEGPHSFTTLASCQAPTTLTATGVTATQANLGWNPVGGTSLWNVEIGATGFLPGTGAQLIAVPGTTDNPTIVTGLMPTTTYQFYVQADCGSGITSTWAGPFSFTTPCEIVSTFPITEDFESTTFPPNCWTRVAGSGNWVRSTAAGGYGISTASAYVNFYNISGSVPMNLMTFEFDASSLVNPQLSFDYAYATYETEIDRLDIYYSTDGGTSYSLLLGMPGGTSGILNTGGALSGSFTPTAAQWATQTLFLPAGTNKIKFTATSAFGNNLYLDNVKIEQGPTCITPTDIASSAITTESATISWTASTSNPADGYDVYYSTSSTAPDGTTTPSGSVLAGITSYDLSGLTEATMYYVWVRSNCGSSDFSEWEGPHSFTTLAACPAPISLTATNIGSTQADLGWNPIGGTSLWNVEVGVIGFIPGTGAELIAETGTTDNPLTVFGLTAQTAYEFYVQSDCGSGDLSVWAGPFTFTTPCDLVSDYPYFEGFNEVTIPDCWTSINLDGDAFSWQSNNTYFYEGTYAAAIHWNSAGNNDWLISPHFEITSADLMLDFYARSISATFLESFNVLISTTGTNPTDFTITLDNVTNLPNAWNNFAYNLADYGINVGDEIYIAIQCVSVDEYYLIVDAFTIREPNHGTDIISYSFPEQTGAAIFDSDAHTVDIEVGNGTDLSALTATFTLSTGATAEVGSTLQVSGVTVNDFTATGSLTYTVTAEDGINSQDWVVTVTEAPINDETDFITFGFDEQTAPAIIDYDYHTINVNINWWSDISQLIADFTLSYGATATIETITQVSGVTMNDFLHTVIYNVLAEDGTTNQNWEVNVTQDAVPQGIVCSDAIPYTINDPDFEAYLPAQNQYYFLVTLPSDYSNVRMMSCGSDFDTKLAYFVACDNVPDLSTCPSFPAGNLGYVDDGGCSSQSYGGSQFASYLSIGNLSAGTYIAVVYGYGTTDGGNVQFRVLGDEVLVTDLSLTFTEELYGCLDFTSEPFSLPFAIENMGNTTIATGEVINFTLMNDAIELINEDVTLTEDLAPAEIYEGMTLSTISITETGTYNLKAYITYPLDENNTNDTVNSVAVVFDQAIEFVDAVEDTITVVEWPYTIVANALINPVISIETNYLWDGGETTNTLEVNAEGWYYLTISTDGCHYTDSVYIQYFNGITDVTSPACVVYPNPTHGMLQIDINLPESGDVLVQIVDALGRTLGETKLSDIETYSEKIDLSVYADGVYSIRFILDDQTITKRITLRK